MGFLVGCWQLFSRAFRERSAGLGRCGEVVGKSLVGFWHACGSWWKALVSVKRSLAGKSRMSSVSISQVVVGLVSCWEVFSPLLVGCR